MFSDTLRPIRLLLTGLALGFAIAFLCIWRNDWPITWATLVPGPALGLLGSLMLLAERAIRGRREPKTELLTQDEP